MAYVPDWERLSDALKRVMATGVTERKAKRNICDAIADGKIRPRFYFMVRPTPMDFLRGRDIRTREVRRVKRDDIPPILNPGDFDWVRSQVLKPELWQKIRGPSDSFFGPWRVVESARYQAGDPFPHSQRGGRSLAYQHRVELRSADVLKVLCTGEKIHDEQVGAVPKLQSGGAKMRGVTQAIIKLWPKSIPKGLSGKERDNAIRTQMEKDGSSIPRDLPRAVQRALKALRQK